MTAWCDSSATDSSPDDKILEHVIIICNKMRNSIVHFGILSNEYVSIRTVFTGKSKVSWASSDGTESCVHGDLAANECRVVGAAFSYFYHFWLLFLNFLSFVTVKNCIDTDEGNTWYYQVEISVLLKIPSTIQMRDFIKCSSQIALDTSSARSCYCSIEIPPCISSVPSFLIILIQME